MASSRTEAARHSFGGWQPTAAHIRAVSLAGLAAFVAVIGRRPDLLVIVAPLVVAALWGQLSRPREEVTAEIDAFRKGIAG